MKKVAGKLMEQYKNDGIPVLKKNWEITDKALLKNDKELGIFLSKLQSLYSHFIKYVSSTQIGEKGNQAEIGAIEKEWKGLEKEGAEIKRNDVKKLYTYTSVAVQTIKEGKQNKSTVAKLNQVVIDGLLSYEKNCFPKKRNNYDNRMEEVHICFFLFFLDVIIGKSALLLRGT